MFAGKRGVDPEFCRTNVPNPSASSTSRTAGPSRGVSIRYLSSNSSRHLVQRASRSLTCAQATLCNLVQSRLAKRGRAIPKPC